MSDFISKYYENIPFDEFVRDFSIFACKWSVRTQTVLCKNIHEYYENKVIVQMVKVLVHREANHLRKERAIFEEIAKHGVSNQEIPETQDISYNAYIQVLTDILINPIINSFDNEEQKE